VTLNGENFFFAASAIKGTTIELGTGTNIINLEAAAVDDPVTIEGGGTEAVNLGSGFFSSTTQGIQGPVTIDNASGSTTINLDDSGDGTAQGFVVGTNPFDSNWGYVHEAALPKFHPL
jgi:hypothetical protein